MNSDNQNIELKLKKIIKDYISSTKISCKACKVDGLEIKKCIGCSELNQFCKLVHKFDPKENYNQKFCTETCRNSCLYGGLQAEKLGAEYIHFCPYGLVKWTVPIFREGEMKYFLSGGPVLMHAVDDLLIEDIVNQNPLLAPEINQIKQSLSRFEVVETDRVRHLARLLVRLAKNIMTRENIDKLKKRQKINRTNEEMAEKIHELKQGTGEKSCYPLDKEKKLISKVKLGDREGARKLLNEILGFIYFKCSGEFEMIKLRIIELIGVLARTAVNVGADLEIIFGLEYEYLEKVNEVREIEKLSNWVTKIVERFIECTLSIKDVKNKDLIHKAMDYIRNNYAQDINLKEVAFEVGLSSSYFSKLFKEEVGMTYTDYLNKVRIEKGKQLLDQGHSLADTAYQVGFNDQSYFSKVFKKVEQVAPGQWKETE